MTFSPDHIIFIDWGWGRLNATLLFTWLQMAVLVGAAKWMSTKLVNTEAIAPWQHLLELLVGGINRHIEEITRRRADPFLPFAGTLFLFILLSNVLSILPGYLPPTASLSTTSALACCVFFAVPYYGLSTRSAASYVRHYFRPTPLMLPFNLIGDLSRTFALAVRLYGNLMSGVVIGSVLLLVMPLFVPVIMSALGLLTGTIQAYIFAVLAMIYIASMLRNDTEQQE